MKLGDFALNKKMINEVETHLKNMTPEEVQEMEIMVKGSAFIGSMIVELLESDTIANLKMDDQKIADLVLKMLGTGVAMGVLNVASRSSDHDVFIRAFKHYFELTAKKFLESR